MLQLVQVTKKWDFQSQFLFSFGPLQAFLLDPAFTVVKVFKMMLVPTACLWINTTEVD